MNTFEWKKRTEEESYTLDQYLKKSPPVLSEELKQKYTKSLEEYKKALRETEIEIRVSLFGNSSLKSLAKDIERLINKIKDYLYLYENWKPTPPAPATPPAPPAPPASPASPAPTTPADTNPIVPPPVTPTDTSTQVGGNTNTQAGGNTYTQTGTGSTNTQVGQNHLAPTTPTTDNEGEPKGGFFTPTNILLMLLVVGGGIFFMTRKGK